MSFLKKILRRETAAPVQQKEQSLKAKGAAEEIAATPQRASDHKAVFGVLRRPHITEKTSVVGKDGTYAFVVSKSVNKPLIKQAVENRYGVRVNRVTVVNIPGKERKKGRQIGWKAGYKKAYVTLAKGQTIDIQ